MGSVLILLGVPALMVAFTWLLYKHGPDAALSFLFFLSLSWLSYGALDTLLGG